MAANGKSLKEISEECRKVSENVATIATAVTPCSIPGAGPLFHMNDDEIDMGLGVHGEAGTMRTKVIKLNKKHAYIRSIFFAYDTDIVYFLSFS